jgi:hypothetical protein
VVVDGDVVKGMGGIGGAIGVEIVVKAEVRDRVVEGMGEIRTAVRVDIEVEATVGDNVVAKLTVSLALKLTAGQQMSATLA